MRDVIWTIIIVWLVYKIIGYIKTVSNKKSQISGSENYQNSNTSIPKKDVKSAIKKGTATEGEYVDYEDIK